MPRKQKKYIRVPKACLLCNKRRVKCVEREHPGGCRSCRRNCAACVWPSERHASSSKPGLAWAVPIVERYVAQHAQLLPFHPGNTVTALRSNSLYHPLLLAVVGSAVHEDDIPHAGQVRQECMRAAEAEMHNVGPCIEAIQTLIVMTMFLVTTQPDLQAASSKLAAAIRMAQVLGLHHEEPNDTLEPMQLEVQRRLWWACFILDRLCAAGGNHPMMIHEDDFHIPLPTFDASWWLATTPLESEQLQQFLQLVQIGGMVTRFNRRLNRHDKPCNGHLVAYTNIRAALHEWYNQLAPATKEPDTPHVALLLTLYYMNHLLIHRSAQTFQLSIFSDQLVRDALHCANMLDKLSPLSHHLPPLFSTIAFLATNAVLQCSTVESLNQNAVRTIMALLDVEQLLAVQTCQ